MKYSLYLRLCLCEIRMTQDSGKYDTGALIHQFRGIAVKKTLFHKIAPYCTFLYTFVCVRIVTHTLFLLWQGVCYILCPERVGMKLKEEALVAWHKESFTLQFHTCGRILQLKEHISRSLFTFAHIHTFHGYMKWIIIICSNSIPANVHTYKFSHVDHTVGVSKKIKIT